MVRIDLFPSKRDDFATTAAGHCDLPNYVDRNDITLVLSRFGQDRADGRIQGNNISTGDRATILTPRTGIDPVFPNAGALNVYTPPAESNGVGLTAANLIVHNPDFVDTTDYADYIAKNDIRSSCR